MFATSAPHCASSLPLYSPRNAGLTVRLPKMRMAQGLNNHQPGYTPFSLNINCQNMRQEGIADRAVEMFLSSNNLLASEASALTNANEGGAQEGGYAWSNATRRVRRWCCRPPMSIAAAPPNCFMSSSAAA
ncbi:hypothetical protein QMZ62_04455 [Serratia sp. PF2-63]|uniref:hypothetical protein n=2 Tax=Serratia TaxID=613 RepID=UPI0021BD5EC5|nr:MULTISPECIES: hypothetical protein [Serratia]MDI6973244.1 hypothetical protein [Serratia sp. Se-RSBMAAmG]MDI9227160.1 hypothetical protein [Serratia bockelmannii]MDI9262213.1 hypothetical protein [Serratia sp. PF2-63]MDI9271065.1 hypothetical protein [Serratia sp. PF-27]